MRVLFRILKRFVKTLTGRLAAKKAVIREQLRIIRRIARGLTERDDTRLRILYRSVFGEEGGQAVLEDLCMRFHIADTTRGAGDPPECRDSEELRRCGERNVVLHILNMTFSPIKGEDPADAG